MYYNFNEIEAKWQKYWKDNKTFHAKNPDPKNSPPSEGLGEAYYVLDMFPYPSGAGLHVGHPLGYIASDIYARYKRHKGFNVLHPQGYDSFGLPAEQYAIQTGQHPALTTEENIKTYRRQLDQIGFSFDWSREVRTSDPKYYKWTQWIFIQLFESWYNNDTNKAESIETLISTFASEGNKNVNAVCDDHIEIFTASDWIAFSSEKQQEILLKYRLTYLAETEVNWCPALGTVLANDEIVNGVSERGGHPVVRKKMTQWSMRISAYAERLLQGLNDIDWTESLKESQRNWIGKSIGATVSFKVIASEAKQSHKIDVFTTRPDTIFGVSFMTLAPEHDLVSKITTSEQKQEVEAYIQATAKRSERDRMSDVKKISGVFTGAYAEHPFSKEPIPIWIGDYVLAGYGTGAVMSVPCGDQRDYDFAKHFNIPIPNIFEGIDISEEAYASKDNVVIANSDFLNGLSLKEATKKVISELEKLDQGEGKINYRLRDAVFSRQRYWGEPFPVYYVNGMPQMIDKKHLPIRLPDVEKYLPTETGEPPLGRADVWAWDTQQCSVVSNELIDHKTVFPLELNTMPGWAGSSWYFFRYMDAQNDEVFASEEALEYWKDVDLYIGGSEHATGHLLYSRFWVKFLKDRGFVNIEEPFKKLINQGMILGTSAFVNLSESFKIEIESEGFSKILNLQSPILFSQHNIEFSHDHQQYFQEFYKTIVNLSSEEDKSFLLSKYSDDVIVGYSEFSRKYNIPVDCVESNGLVNLSKFKNWEMYNSTFGKAELIESFDLYADFEVEKMSKSKYNVVNPDAICEQYGADSLRMYEMFLGPLEQAKPWNTAGISGVNGFLKKLWKLYHQGENGSFYVNSSPPSEGLGEDLKTLHRTIKKVEEDIESFSFNTSVSTFMIAVNELTAQKCTSKVILEPLLILLSPYAPHVTEELWSKLGHSESISKAPFPKFDASHLVESSKNYPISFNGKMKFTLELPMDMSKEDIEKTVLAHEKTIAQLEGRTPKKVIIVPGKIVNIVG